MAPRPGGRARAGRPGLRLGGRPVEDVWRRWLARDGREGVRARPLGLDLLLVLGRRREGEEAEHGCDELQSWMASAGGDGDASRAVELDRREQLAGRWTRAACTGREVVLVVCPRWLEVGRGQGDGGRCRATDRRRQAVGSPSRAAPMCDRDRGTCIRPRPSLACAPVQLFALAVGIRSRGWAEAAETEQRIHQPPQGAPHGPATLQISSG